MCLRLGRGVLFASNPYYSLVSFRTVFFYCRHGDGFSSQGRLLGSNFTDQLFLETIMLYPLGSISYQYKIYSCIRVCNLWGLTCSQSTSVRLTFPLLCGNKIIYRVYLLSSIFFTYVFSKVVVTAAFCIFSVVITTAPHWRFLVCYVYYLSGDHHHRIFGPVYNHCQALSVLFIFIHHHDQSTTVN